MDTIVTVMGNLTADPQQRLTAQGLTVVNLRVASSSRRFDKESQTWKDGDPMFISVTAWRQLANNAYASLRKGDGVIIHGRLTSRVYEDKEGNRRQVHEIEAMAVGPDCSRHLVEVRRVKRAGEVESAEVSAEAVEPVEAVAEAAA